jgi:hypothetical protein
MSHGGSTTLGKALCCPLPTQEDPVAKLPIEAGTATATGGERAVLIAVALSIMATALLWAWVANAIDRRREGDGPWS